MDHSSDPFPPLIIVMGVSASGKSTFGAALAERLQIPFVEGDLFHSPASVDKMASGIPLEDEDRWPWLDKLALMLAEAEKKQGCVMACSALKRIYRDRLRSATSNEPTLVYLHARREVLLERLGKRKGHFFPVELLDSQLNTMEAPEEDEKTIRLDLRQDIETLLAHALDQLQASGGWSEE